MTRNPSLLSRLVWRILLGLYRWKGWRFEGAAPDVRKCVILGAPHTSNWDFIFVLGAAQRMGIPPGFIGKHTLFKWPMGGFMRDMGGISIERGRGERSDRARLGRSREFARRDRRAVMAERRL